MDKIFDPEYHWHKRSTHLTIYAEDMLKHVRSFSRENRHFKLSLSLLEDRAHGSLFLFPMKIVEQMLKASPIVVYTNLSNIDLSHVSVPSPGILKEDDNYSPIQKLLKIIAISNDLLDDLNEEKRISRSSLHELAVTVEDFYNWAVETFPRFEEEAEDEAPVKTVEKNIEWFAMLCDHLAVERKMSARSLWNIIKDKSSPEKPVCFDDFQVVLHDEKLFYSSGPLTPRLWREYLEHEEAVRIVYKSFENYLSRYKKNLPNNPNDVNSVD